VDAMLYVVKTGCQWRQLSTDFPPWKSVHEQFRAWRDSGVWERAGKAMCTTP
jgi:transposase